MMTFQFKGFFSEGDKFKYGPSKGRYRYGMLSTVEIEANTVTDALKKLKKRFKSFKIESYRQYDVIRDQVNLRRNFNYKPRS